MRVEGRKVAGVMRPAIQRMLDPKEPHVLDVIVPYTEHVLPFVPANRTVADMISGRRKSGARQALMNAGDGVIGRQIHS